MVRSCTSVVVVPPGYARLTDPLTPKTAPLAAPAYSVKDMIGTVYCNNTRWNAFRYHMVRIDYDTTFNGNVG